jgi:hypothetical protein
MARRILPHAGSQDDGSRAGLKAASGYQSPRGEAYQAARWRCEVTLEISLDYGHIERQYDAEGFTFHPVMASDWTSDAGVKLWTKYQEEGRGSEELVNIDLARIKIDDITIIDGRLCLFGKTLAGGAA